MPACDKQCGYTQLVEAEHMLCDITESLSITLRLVGGILSNRHWRFWVIDSTRLERPTGSCMVTSELSVVCGRSILQFHTCRKFQWSRWVAAAWRDTRLRLFHYIVADHSG